MEKEKKNVVERIVKWIRGRGKEIVLCCAVLVLLTPFLYTMTYSLPSPDDFWKALGYTGNGVFRDAVVQANDFYFNWFGGWIWEFLELLINPLIWFEPGSRFYGIEMILFFAFFILCLFFLIREANKYILKRQGAVYNLAILFLFLFVFLNSKVWSEILYWFCGANYMWAMSLMCLTMAWMLRNYLGEYRAHRSVAIAIIGFIACTSYTETIFPGLLYLYLIVRDYKKCGRFEIKKAYPLLFMVAGGLSCLLAPGNMARYHSTEASALSMSAIVKALGDTGARWGTSVREMLHNPCLFVAMCAFIFVGAYWGDIAGKHLSWKKLVAFIAASSLGLYLTYLPFALGYASDIYFPNRMQYVFYVYAIMAGAMICMYLGAMVGKGIRSNSVQAGMLFGVIAYVLLVVNGGIQDSVYMQTIYQAGQVRQAYRNWDFMLETIASSEGDDVELEWFVFDTPIIRNPGITEDSDNDVNQRIAQYFGKRSVKMKWLT